MPARSPLTRLLSLRLRAGPGRLWLRWVAPALLLVASSAGVDSGERAPLPPRGYTLRDLGTLGGEQSGATALNNHGEVVGWAETGGAVRDGVREFHAVRWAADGIQDLGTLGEYHSAAFGINNRGEVVGGVLSGFDPEPFVWSTATGMHRLPLKDNFAGVGLSINDHGTIAGYFETTGYDKAGMWTDRLRWLSHPWDGRALDVNNRGEVVGWGETLYDGLPKAFRWRGRRGRRLEPPPYRETDPWSKAHAINDRGTIVGELEGRAFIWAEGRLRRLPAGAGYQKALAADLNRREQVVGTLFNHRNFFGPSEFPASPTGTAALWERGRLTDLSDVVRLTSGWHLETAAAINDRGQIVGIGRPEGEGRGPRRAYLLTPVERER
ncbi:MAG: hypothetical protein ACK47B_06645 [Armatimonadota bacterium]